MEYQRPAITPPIVDVNPNWSRVDNNSGYGNSTDLLHKKLI